MKRSVHFRFWFLTVRTQSCASAFEWQTMCVLYVTFQVWFFLVQREWNVTLWLWWFHAQGLKAEKRKITKQIVDLVSDWWTGERQKHSIRVVLYVIVVRLACSNLQIGQQAAEVEGKLSTAEQWCEQSTPEGVVYYWNPTTNESVWEKPNELLLKDEVILFFRWPPQMLKEWISITWYGTMFIADIDALGTQKQSVETSAAYHHCNRSTRPCPSTSQV